MGARRKAREAALQMLYQLDLSELNAEQVVDSYRNNLLIEPGAARAAAAVQEASDDDDAGLLALAPRSDAFEFARELVLGCAAARSEIDERIRQVSRHWRLERMAKVDRNIIRLACYELMHRPEIPRKVSLNEAVELAKRFGDDGAAAFVNGVLDRIAADLGKA